MDRPQVDVSEAVMLLLKQDVIPEGTDFTVLAETLAALCIGAQYEMLKRGMYPRDGSLVMPTRRDLLLWFWIYTSFPARQAPGSHIQQVIDHTAKTKNDVATEYYRVAALLLGYTITGGGYSKHQSIRCALANTFGKADGLISRIVADGPIFLEPAIAPDGPWELPEVRVSLEAGRPWVRASEIFSGAALLTSVSDERIPTIVDWYDQMKALIPESRHRYEEIRALLVSVGIPRECVSAILPMPPSRPVGSPL